MRAPVKLSATCTDADQWQPMPIGTADAGSAITRELCAGADYIMANVSTRPF